MAAIGTRLLKLEVDGEDMTTQVSVVEFLGGPSESDFTTFAAAATGGARDYTLHVVAVQDAASGTFWDTVWTLAGTEIPVTIMPYGNATPSVGQPHFTMTAVITEPDGVILGGEANSSTSSRFTIDVEWQLTAKPTRVTA